MVRGAKPVTGERVKVHGTDLQGNLEGNAVEREVIVFLPPSYAREKSRRYPVVYALHGLHEALDRYGIANRFEVYPGTHTSAVADRFQNHVLKFFGESLCFEQDCQ